MLNKQTRKEQKATRLPSAVLPIPSSYPSRENEFMSHFDSLRNSKASTEKSCRTTDGSDYELLFENYSKRESQSSHIRETFDNGKLYELFEQPHTFIPSQAFLSMSPHIQTAVQHVNLFFTHDQPFSNPQSNSYLTSEHFASQLASSLSPSPQQQSTPSRPIERSSTQNIRYSMDKNVRQKPQKLVQSKIDLLLTEISRQKHRKELSQCYEQAMIIKLTEFVDYITENDDRYLGLDLQGKACEIMQNITEYKGKMIDNCLTLPLLKYFFSEFKQFQEERLLKTKSKKASEKISALSELKLKSSRAGSRKDKKYSEPNSRRQKDLKQQDWIGNLS